MHIFGLHAADLIHEASNAVATGQTVTDIKFNVHAHPTLSEVQSAIKQLNLGFVGVLPLPCCLQAGVRFSKIAACSTIKHTTSVQLWKHRFWSSDVPSCLLLA